MRVAIATVGRFWVLDLARELSALGHDVTFWSGVSRRTAASFGLPPEAHRSLRVSLSPWLVAQRYAGALGRPSWAERGLLEAADRLIARRLEPCDVFIGMSGLCVESARAARTKYGATVFLERGSRHILSQKAILEGLAESGMAADTVPEWAVTRELAGYALADRVVVPSLQVERSFLEHGVAPEKLFRNPYGVDLSMFAPTPVPAASAPTLLFVGTWSYRKGVDLLERAWRSLDGVRLIHVGPVGDAPLPQAEGFVHAGAVPQSQLRDYYAQAHVCVLASREEGLALVQVQALACGVPLVCTDRTGGEDLRDLLGDRQWVSVVPADDAEALAEAMRTMLARAAGRSGVRDVLGMARDRFAWSAYGRRYADELARVVSSMNQPV